MQKNKIVTTIGLMSGTSMDGIDAALIKSDGRLKLENCSFSYLKYSKTFREKLTLLINNKVKKLSQIKEIEQELTLLHLKAVEKLLANSKIKASQIDAIGFHGQTIMHKPQKSITWQLGDAMLLAIKSGIDVVANFRSRDMIFGGHGAPLVPLYHRALLQGHATPTAILNIGGVSNITYISNNKDSDLLAFDVSPGNAPLDDFIKLRTGQAYDRGGKLALKGVVNEDIVKKFLNKRYFKKKPPKSLDRNNLQDLDLSLLSTPDGLATICAIIAGALNLSLKYLPKPPKNIYICGGGRHNKRIMRELNERVAAQIQTIDEIDNVDGDAIEAQAFAYLAARHLLGLPTSLPNITGAKSDTANKLCGGVLYRDSFV